MSSEKKLVFIYNANSDFINLFKDFWHKLLKPSTYQCNLCLQTYGNYGMKKEWKKFINGLNINVEFLHKNEFEEKYKISDVKFPSAFIEQYDSLDLLISQNEMNAVNSIDKLKNLVDSKLKDFILIKLKKKVE